MKLNIDKRHLTDSGTKYEYVWVKKGKDKTWEIDNMRLLGVNIDNISKFDQHV